MARLAVLAACGLAMLAMVSYVNADATAFATSLSRAARDAPGCGELDAPCCLRGGKRCNDKGLACMSLETAQETKCRACGSEGLPACEGLKCEKGLEPVTEGLPIPICVAKTRNPPGLAKKGKPAKGNKKAENDYGKILLGACSADSDCERGACIANLCVPCGGPKQACCNGDSPCRSYGKKGLVCVEDPKGKLCKNQKADS